MSDSFPAKQTGPYTDRLIVVIDDERSFETDSPVLYLRDSKSALAYLARTMMHQQTKYGQAIDELWLDHDLGHPEDYPEGRSDSVMPIVHFLELIAHTHLKLIINKIFVHSQNPVGSENMMSILSKHYHVMRVPLPELVN